MTPGLGVALAALQVLAAAGTEEGAGGYLQPTVSYHGLRVLGFSELEAQAVQANFAARVGSARPVRLGSAATDVAERCQADAYCHCREARQSRATHALWGNVGRLDKLHTVELVLLDAQDCTQANSAFTSQVLEEGELPVRMEDLLAKVLTPKETVSQAATKRERPQQDVPALVTVFTAAQLRRLGITRPAELFRLVPGFEAMEMNWGTMVLHNGMSGTMLFMQDGVPLSHALFSVLFLDVDLRFNMEALERVELVRGPLGVLWGPYALLGVVNFVTRRAESEQLQLSAQARAGTLDTQEATVSVSQRTPRVSYAVTAAFHRTRGPVTYVPDSTYGVPPGATEPLFGNSGFTTNRPDLGVDVQGKVQLFDERLTLSIAHSELENRYQISPRGGLLPPDADAYWQRSVRVYSATWEDALAEGLRLRLFAAQVEHTLDESFALDPGSPDGTVEALRYVQGNRAEPLVSRNGEARLQHDATLGIARSAALLGVAYYGQTLPDTFATPLVGAERLTVPVLDIPGRRFDSFAGFIQEDVTLFDRLTLSGGLRYEHRAPFPSVLGKQGAIVARLPADLRGKLIYSEGFRPPQANSLFSTQATQGNPDLRPERSRNLSLELGGERHGLSARVSGSVGELFDLIVADPTAASPGFEVKPLNKGSIAYVAAQAEVGAQHPLGELSLSYGFKRLRESEPEGRGIAVAPHTASAAVTVHPFNDVSAFAAGWWVSPRRVAVRTAQGRSEELIPSTFGLDGGVRIANVWKGLSLELLLKNPLGLEQRVPYRLDGFPNMLVERRAGREVLLGLRFAL